MMLPSNRSKSRSQSALPQRQRWSSSLSQPHLLEAQQEHTIKTRLHYTAIQTPKPPPPNYSPGRGPITNPQPADRPRSALPRPLSGKVFMRNSSKHGWVAKAYPPGSHNSSSQPNLDTDFFTESCESFDSFFDDEFEEQEKLGNLLSCNTLGVETKATKQDWVSGEIDIPRFHCPRCRDHWYGITSEPCDEELARLIREGLWRTGKDGKQSDKNMRKRQFALNASKNSAQEFSQEGSPGGNNPTVRHGSFSLQKGTTSSHSNWTMKRKEDEKDKKKKRITFLLDGEESGSQDGSATSLEGRGGKGRGTGQTRGGALDSQGKFVAGDGKEGRGSEVGMRGRGKENRVDGGGMGESIGGGGSGETGGMGRRGRGREAGGEAVDGGGGMERKSGDAWESGYRHHTFKGDRKNGEVSSGSTTSENNVLQSQGKSGEVLASDHDTEDPRSFMKGASSSSGGQEGYRKINGDAEREGERQGNNGDSEQGVDGLSSHQDGENADTARRGRGSLLKERFAQRIANTNTSVENKEKDGEMSNFVKPTDYGKRIRKAGGYMRAAPDDPASSEWADPLHARSFISSTATSRMGSTSNLHDTPAEDEDSSTGRGFLPPIVHPISRPPPLYSMDFMGPSLTRPWTFSYH